MKLSGCARLASRVVMAGAVVVATGVSPALAQYYTPQNKAELTLYGGAYFGGTVYTGSSTVFRRDVNVSDDLAVGGRLAYIFNRSIGLEGGYGYSQSDLKLAPGGGQGAQTFGQLTESRYELNFNFYTNPGPVVGYFTLGGGLTHFKAEANPGLVAGRNEASDDRFSSNIGLGIKLHTSEAMALRFDGRWRYTDTDVGGDQFYCDIYGFCYSYDSSYYSSGELTGGLSYSF